MIELGETYMLSNRTDEAEQLFRRAVRLMPAAVQEVTRSLGLSVDDLELVLAHQANQRILDGVASRLGVAEDVVVSNIERYGNTTAATLPLLYHDVRADGRLRPGSRVAFTAFGAGAHWGALIYRVPTAAT